MGGMLVWIEILPSAFCSEPYGVVSGVPTIDTSDTMPWMKFSRRTLPTATAPPCGE